MKAAIVMSVNELSALILSGGFKLVQWGILFNYALLLRTKIKHCFWKEILFWVKCIWVHLCEKFKLILIPPLVTVISSVQLWKFRVQYHWNVKTSETKIIKVSPFLLDIVITIRHNHNVFIFIKTMSVNFLFGRINLNCNFFAFFKCRSWLFYTVINLWNTKQ